MIFNVKTTKNGKNPFFWSFFEFWTTLDCPKLLVNELDLWFVVTNILAKTKKKFLNNYSSYRAECETKKKNVKLRSLECGQRDL